MGGVSAGPSCRKWAPNALLALLTWCLASPTLAGLNLALTLYLIGRDALKASSLLCRTVLSECSLLPVSSHWQVLLIALPCVQSKSMHNLHRLPLYYI